MDWLDGAERHPSPNCDARPAGVAVDLLVIHAISLPPGCYAGDYVQQLFTNRLPAAGHPYFAQIHRLRVSAHLYIRRAGQVIQFVPFGQRAWHAGESAWQGRTMCNDFSIGIELEGSDADPFTAAQYAALQSATRTIRAAFPAILKTRIVGHADIAAGRKTDPGPQFDWPRYLASLDAGSATEEWCGA
ncbi:MAG: 1,6-anhydro-N-acetylmuramyl-L-alanine amidase AmpD [Cellvibrionales bacterium]|nr:1,6-anhydro-N-acetylmuramyl-L-alanine amidase AmpD [Cellvibrionales bacterium]